MKKSILYAMAIIIPVIFIIAGKSYGQSGNHTLYVTGTVSSDEKMMITARTKYIEGRVSAEPYKVTAEINGKKTEGKTDQNGHALLDFSAIAAGLVNPAKAVIKSFDKKGNLLSTVSTTVYPGNTHLTKPPVLENIPANLSVGEAVTIQGQHLGADAKFYCSGQEQETLAASDKEMVVFNKTRPGEQPVYVITPNGVSQSQTVNFYSLNIELSKNSITPGENVQATVQHESIPPGSKLIFTNLSPGIINMAIPGGQNTGNESIYTVVEKNGTIPVHITGLTKGDFRIAMNTDFVNDKEDTPPLKHFDQEQPGKNEEQPNEKENHQENPPIIPQNPPNKGECPCKRLDLQVVQTVNTKPVINYGAQEELFAGLIKVPHLDIKWFNGKWEINKNDKAPDPVQGPRTRIKYQIVKIKIPYEATLACEEGEKICKGGVVEVYCENINIKPSLPADYSVLLNNGSTASLAVKCGNKITSSGSVVAGIKIPKLDINKFEGNINLVFKIICENNISFVRLKIDILNGKLLQESFEPWSKEKN